MAHYSRFFAYGLVAIVLLVSTATAYVNPPACPPDAQFGLKPMDEGLASESLCRGACGPDCPDTCTDEPDEQICITDSSDESFYTCTYTGIKRCGTHEACIVHDARYDACAEKGETKLCLEGGWCHCRADFMCGVNSWYSPWNCFSWKNGEGPYTGYQKYYAKVVEDGPFPYCPGKEPEKIAEVVAGDASCKIIEKYTGDVTGVLRNMGAKYARIYEIRSSGSMSGSVGAKMDLSTDPIVGTATPAQLDCGGWMNDLFSSGCVRQSNSAPELAEWSYTTRAYGEQVNVNPNLQVKVNLKASIDYKTMDEATATATCPAVNY
ncbi:MAG: hypothetical protein ABH829_01930 [archaeon]